MKNKINKSLDGLHDFMAKAYQGNWQYRFSQTPYLEYAIKNGKKDSIIAHQWACIGFWFHLQRICPALSSLVDSKEIYEILWSHDLGETFAGDVSQALQIRGYGLNKHAIEREEIKKLGKNIPPKTLKELIKWFDEFSNAYENSQKLEILVAKFIDVFQGDHVVLFFGKNLKAHSEMINKIVSRTFIRITHRLLGVLKARNHKKAYKEVRQIALHHINLFKKAGVKIDLGELNLKKL